MSVSVKRLRGAVETYGQITRTHAFSEKAGALDSSTTHAVALKPGCSIPGIFQCLFDQPVPPAMPGRPPYEHEVVKTWTAELAGPDGFIFGTPEYSYGPTTVRWRVPVRRRW